MRALIAWLTLAACGMAAGPRTVTTSPHKVGWGWGCGGNCAVNFSGESETSLATGSSDVRLEDRGALTRRQSDPGGLVISTTRWRYAFHGKSTAGNDRLEFALRTDVSECTRTVETHIEGKPDAKKTAPCPSPPKRWKLVCERRQVQVKDRPRPAWVCSPAQAMDPFGTDFPWVFGIDAPITTVVSGEPHPQTSYE
jgi:hypothetical protein